MFRRILLPLDGSALAEATLPHALVVAQLTGAELILLHVAEVYAGSRSVDPLDWQLQRAADQTYLAEVCGQLRALGITCEFVLDAGSPTERIIDQAKRLQADLVLVSSHGRSDRTDPSPGRVAQTLMEHLGTSGMLVQARAGESAVRDVAPAGYRTILIPLDGSQRAECVLPLANHLALAQGARVVLAHVVHTPALLSWAVPRVSSDDRGLAEQLMHLNHSVAEQYLTQLQARQDAPTTIAIGQGDNVAIELHRLAEQHGADLVLISAHGAGANPLRLFGDTLSNFLAYCRQPILVFQDRPEAQSSEPETTPQRDRASVHVLPY